MGDLGATFAGIVTDGSLLLAIAVAALVGLISFASPCVLPLVPGYLGYVAGLTGASAAQPSALATDRITSTTGAIGTAAARPSRSDRRRVLAGALLGQILTNAADRADVDVDDIEVLRAEMVVWNDGSLGCPEPGMMYTQALVDGYHVVLDADGTELDYRATTTGDYRFCENPGPPSGG